MDNEKPIKNTGRSIQLLFVEDDSFVVRIAEMYFGHKGYLIKPAYNGREALEIFKKYHDLFDVVVTDYSMPKMNGLELALAIKEIVADARIILITGKSEFIDKNQIAEAGITKTIIKPFKFDELDSTIKEVLAG